MEPMGGKPAFSPATSPSSCPCMDTTPPIRRFPVPNQSVRRQPSILRDNGLVNVGRKQNCADLAGETAADCAAVCCCCSCGLLEFLVLATVRVPAGLCQKAIRRRKMNLKKKKKMVMMMDDTQEGANSLLLDDFRSIQTFSWHDRTQSEEILEMDRKMWEKFSSTGFWRSPSRKDS